MHGIFLKDICINGAINALKKENMSIYLRKYNIVIVEKNRITYYELSIIGNIVLYLSKIRVQYIFGI